MKKKPQIFFLNACIFQKIDSPCMFFNKETSKRKLRSHTVITLYNQFFINSSHKCLERKNTTDC